MLRIGFLSWGIFVLEVALALVLVLLFGAGKSFAQESLETRSGILITSGGQSAINVSGAFYQFRDVPLNAVGFKIGFQAEVSGFWQEDLVEVQSVTVTEGARETIYFKDVISPTGGTNPSPYALSGILAVRSMKPAVILSGPGFFGYQSVAVVGPALEDVQTYLGRPVALTGDVAEGLGMIAVKAEKIIMNTPETEIIYEA